MVEVARTQQFDKEGNVVREWVRSKADGFNTDDLIAALRKNKPTFKRKFAPPKTSNKNLMLEWCIADTHMGMHSWAKQTGANYNLKIAKELVQRASERIFSVFNDLEEIVLVLLGDNQHSDNRSNETERGHNKVDVDGRYPKAVDYTIETFCAAIDLALQHAQKVKVIVVFGNHDYHSAIWLQALLKFGYRNEKRVVINDSQHKMKFNQWGISFFGYHHGDTAPATRLVDQLLTHIIDHDIIGVRRKLLRKGHLHKEGKLYPPGLTDHNGVTIEIMPTIAAPDAWSKDAAWASIRATKAQLFHKEFGPQQSLEIPAIQLMEGF